MNQKYKPEELTQKNLYDLIDKFKYMEVFQRIRHADEYTMHEELLTKLIKESILSEYAHDFDIQYPNRLKTFIEYSLSEKSIFRQLCEYRQKELAKQAFDNLINSFAYDEVFRRLKFIGVLGNNVKFINSLMQEYILGTNMHDYAERLGTFIDHIFREINMIDFPLTQGYNDNELGKETLEMLKNLVRRGKYKEMFNKLWIMGIYQEDNPIFNMFLQEYLLKGENTIYRERLLLFFEYGKSWWYNICFNCKAKPYKNLRKYCKLD